MKRLHFMMVSLMALLLSSCNFFTASTEKTIFIGSTLEPCTSGVMKATCLQVKWTKDQAEWEHFYGPIEGFDFEKGFEYELIVREEKVENAPADASSLKYSLIKIVSKNKVSVIANGDNSQNALDWEGLYKGTLPCADCEGIATTISLNADGTFNRTQEYLGKNRKPFTDNGTFEWNSEGSRITLMASSDNQEYQVGENQLFHLDQNGNQIKGNLSEKYILTKISVPTDANATEVED